MKAIKMGGSAGMNNISAIVNAKIDRLSFSGYEFITKVLFLIADSPGFWNEFVSLTPDGADTPPLDVVRTLVEKWTERTSLENQNCLPA